VSGIIEAHRHDAEDPLVAAGLALVEHMKIDDWLALVFSRA
jgi:ribosomal protein L11 methylase PrmA